MKIGILGATGAVGRQMIDCLIERKMDVEELRLFASSSSKGKKIAFKESEIAVQEVKDNSFEGLDYVLGAVGNELSKRYWPLMQKAQAVFVDNSSAFRMDEDVPLIVPEINGEDALKHKGLIANPNCSTIITMMAVAPINRLSRIRYMYASTYQAVSGAGIKGFDELTQQIEKLRNNERFEPKVFRKQIAFNCIPEIGSYLDNGYTSEEMKMQNEGRKILHLPELKVSCTCVRVPVYRSHAISVSLVCENKLDLKDVRKAIDGSENVEYKDDIPTQAEVSDKDIVYVGRLRKDLCNDNGISLWCCGDQIRKGAATNAVEIIEYLEKHK
ncbi:MAG: aspartate-semialdehyde dehydrogenase [Erysipelotrichaceae bacterium]|nr:aspartate-semialdehyde dehydrogenase [Erysipelotrichaceae bacterium]